MSRTRPPLSALSHQVVDRALGCFVGLAVGDAVGTTTLGAPFDSARLHADPDASEQTPRLVRWSSPTAMALALAATLLDPAGYSSHGLMTRLGQWLQSGHFASQGQCVGIGRSTRAAIGRFIATGQVQWIPDKAAAAGSGSLCRLAPVALAFLHQPAMAEQVARQQSYCTHASPEAADACTYFATLLRLLILSGTAHLSIAGPRITEMAPGRFVRQPRSLRTGQVCDTLDLALSSLHHTDCFDAAVSSATAFGGHAVSVGAVAGMLAGARYGYSAIPKRWLNRLARRNHIRSVAHDLLGTASC